MSEDDKHLSKVEIAADVYAICVQHALTSEKEEIMGMLIGEVDDAKVSKISGCMILKRSDKKPDRVEISPEQLCMASTYAEGLAAEIGRPMRVVGWYHSHPHITVFPSVIDIQTQLTYQTMDPFFVGLIVSVFQSDNSTRNQLEVICFQATQTHERRDIEMEIKNVPYQSHNLESVAQLPRILLQEEMEGYIMSNGGSGEQETDFFAEMHNDAMKVLSLVHLADKISKPMCESLAMRVKLAKQSKKALKKVLKELEERIETIENDH